MAGMPGLSKVGADRSFCRKCHIITSVDVCSGPVRLKVGHSLLPLRALKRSFIMLGGSNAGPIRGCGHHELINTRFLSGEIDPGTAATNRYGGSMRELPILLLWQADVNELNFHTSAEGLLRCARPSRASHLERRPGQLLRPFHMHFAVKAET